MLVIKELQRSGIAVHLKASEERFIFRFNTSSPEDEQRIRAAEAGLEGLGIRFDGTPNQRDWEFDWSIADGDQVTNWSPRW